MIEVIIFIAGTVLMFFMGIRATRSRRNLIAHGEKVDARVVGTAQSRDGIAYILEFETAGGSHRLHYPKPRKGKEWAGGSQVVLYYDPEKPEHLYVEGDSSMLGGEIIYYVIGAVLLCLTLAIAA